MKKGTLSNTMKNFFKKLTIAFAVLIILAAVFSSIFRSLTPWAKQYKGDVEQHLTLLLGQPVSIKSMETGWYWFAPVVRLNQVTINSGQTKTINIDKVLVGINLFKSLWYRRIQPGMLYIDTIHLVLREKKGHWDIDGLWTNGSTSKEVLKEHSLEVLSWLSQQDKLMLKHVSAHVHLENGSLIPIDNLNLSIKNNGGYYKIKAAAQLEQTNKTHLEVLGQITFDIDHIYHTNGQLYFSATHFIPSQWQGLFPKIKPKFEGGTSDFAVWMDLNKGMVSSVQAQVKLKRLAWTLPDVNKRSLIQSFNANLAWKPDDTGWQFYADKIKLRIKKVLWPENQLVLTFDKKKNSYKIFMKSLQLESLLAEAINWPNELQKWIALQPQGSLSDTQIQITDHKLSAFLTRFDHLSWNAKENIPQVKNISGVLNWQPEEGRLELDAANTLITTKGLPPQNFTLLNAGFDWKQLSQGLRLSIDRLVMSKADLTLSAQGVIDNLSSNSLGNLNLEAEFSGKNIEQWIPYLAALKQKKPSLYTWLSKDLKHIAQATGKVTIHGLAEDFPFDNQNGQFNLTSHVNGGELLITQKWQLIKDLDAYIRVKNRNFEVDVVHGDFQGVPVNQMHLQIDDIGKDRETLLVYGIVQGPAQKIMNFVMNSPLKEKLSTLKMLTLKGMLSLNLRLQLPLYPEDNENLALGDLTFNNNTVLVKHDFGVLKVTDVTGKLSFDEHGVTQSVLGANAFSYPLSIKIHNEKTPKPATVIAIEGEYSMESIKEQLQFPFLSLFKGIFSAKTVIKLTDDSNDLDNLNLKTSLKGLAIDLPMPLGKAFKEETSLDFNLDFKVAKTIRLRANYNNRFSADLMFEGKKTGFDLSSGQIRLGSALALDQNQPGITVVGTLDGFDLQEWKKMLSQWSTTTGNSTFLDKLQLIDITLDKFTFLNQQFDDMKIKAKTLPKQGWSFNVVQKKIAADFNYYPTSNLVDGYIRYLKLAKPDWAVKESEEAAAKLNPDQIPNLNLRVDNISLGNKPIGNVTLKSKTSAQRLWIEYCKIESPFYQLMLNGDWSQQGKINKTKIVAKLHLIDLAKNLQRLEINPVVDASKGDIQFDGGWKGTPSDFSLASLTGRLYMELKNGRITQLSPETEEKLGLGKLLSVLSLQTIPRRLKLDFSDLSHEGYSFDIYKGNFVVTQGIMNTQDSYIDGPVAYGSMKGDLDLARRSYDLNLSISPHITASLPIVATIAGGPIAGIAAWVANKIINQSMQKITGYSYKISGPWDQPIVQQLSIVKHQASIAPTKKQKRQWWRHQLKEENSQ